MHRATGLASLAFTLAALATPVAAQSVVGRVLDGETERPVVGAVVALDTTRLRAVTDSSGRFLIRRVPAGEYSLRVEHVAYATRTDTVVVPAEGILELTVAVATDAIALDPITVTVRSAGELDRRTQGHPHHVFITRRDIDRYEEEGAADVGDLFQMHAPLAVEVRPTTNAGWVVSRCIATERRRLSLASPALPRANRRSPFNPESCNAALVVVDDMPVPEIIAPAVLRDLPLEAIHRLEFLPPVDARVRYGGPAEYGAVVIQTRTGHRPARDALAADITPDELLDRLRDRLRPRHWPYPVAGALVGVAAGTSYIFYRGGNYVSACRSTECIRTAVAKPMVPVVAGAVLGAIVGEVLFRLTVLGDDPR